jgi:hypothetical protein
VCARVTTNFIACGVTTEEVKRSALTGKVKGGSKPRFTCLPFSHNIPAIARDTITISKTGHMITVVL